jgi:hypothetical protein
MKLAAGVAFAALVVVLAPLASRSGSAAPFAAEAQNMGLRVVSGYVSDADGNPVVGATVFLKDLKSKSIRSFTSAEKGRFRFANTSMAEDHELWAEKGGKKSAVKSISTWDARKEIEVELRLK